MTRKNHVVLMWVFKIIAIQNVLNYLIYPFRLGFITQETPSYSGVALQNKIPHTQYFIFIIFYAHL